jgi:hypothetical protein
MVLILPLTIVHHTKIYRFLFGIQSKMRQEGELDHAGKEAKDHPYPAPQDVGHPFSLMNRRDCYRRPSGSHQKPPGHQRKGTSQ